jgi:uncharacterized protein
MTENEKALVNEEAGSHQTGEAVARMLATRRIAIVGLSDDPSRPSNAIGAYLLRAGYEIIGINPTISEALGVPIYPNLKAVPGKIDLVNVFRRPLACGQIAREAVEIGAKGLWLQSGIMNEEAKRIANAAGIDFVQDRCIMVEHWTRAYGSA